MDEGWSNRLAFELMQRLSNICIWRQSTACLYFTRQINVLVHLFCFILCRNFLVPCDDKYFCWSAFFTLNFVFHWGVLLWGIEYSSCRHPAVWFASKLADKRTGRKIGTPKYSSNWYPFFLSNLPFLKHKQPNFDIGQARKFWVVCLVGCKTCHAIS